VRENKDERYHYLRSVRPEEDLLSVGLEELTIDFKGYFTLPTDELYRQITVSVRRRCRLLSPYMEHLSLRFFQFQQRIGLPEDHFKRIQEVEG
jgi:hypothetical protein